MVLLFHGDRHNSARVLLKVIFTYFLVILTPSSCLETYRHDSEITCDQAFFFATKETRERLITELVDNSQNQLRGSGKLLTE